MAGGMDMISPAGYAKPGTCRYTSNYEHEFGGGYRRVGGFERYSGQPAPSAAEYALLEASAGFTSVAIGNTVTGDTSGATGIVFYISDDSKQIALTKVTGSAFTEEQLRVAGTPIGTVTEEQPAVNGFIDNKMSAGAADVYRADIAKPPGSGPIRGAAILNNVTYCWRDSGANLVTYKATSTGWQVVPLFNQVAFTAGSVAPTEGAVLTQGGASATVKRVVLQSGSWAGGTAAGRLVIAPIAGTFAAGVAGGTGVCTLSGPAAAIQMLAGGRVSSVVYNFTASLSTKRLYCCDGVNSEFEFDGTVLVPITTGMGSIKAKHVICHKKHLMYLFNGSLQHSGIGLPYQWSPVVGAAELGTGDIGTNLVTIRGSEAAAALLVICQDSAWVLYGNSEADWNFVQISEELGAQPYSAQELTTPLAFDRNDFTKWRPTQAFGNFSFDSASRAIEPLIRGGAVKASVLVKDKSKYRCLFGDGFFVTGTPIEKGDIAWMAGNYGRTMECAVGGEIDGTYRIFYGDADGWVLEADVGRSFDGKPIEATLRQASMNQKSSVVIKQYRRAELEIESESAFELSVAAEFSDGSAEAFGLAVEGDQTDLRQYGAGLFWDFENWDRAYYDAPSVGRPAFSINGQGRSVSLVIRSVSATELPHTIKSGTLLYTPRRLAR